MSSSDRRDRDRALLRRGGRYGYGGSQPCMRGECYYCGRTLLVAVPLSASKHHALSGGYLTCGPCVYVEGRLPWREPSGRGMDEHARRRWAMRQAMRGEPVSKHHRLATERS